MENRKIIIRIGASSDHFGAYAENCPGIYGAGNTVQEAKKNALEGLSLFVKHNPNNLPEILKGEYEIEYQFDVPSFLEYYSKVFSKTALERLTGINQKQLFHYASGHRKPSEKTVRKLDNAIHRFSDELRQVHFS
jgi:predicted RNase H-like HicB family nuclease